MQELFLGDVRSCHWACRQRLTEKHCVFSSSQRLARVAFLLEATPSGPFGLIVSDLSWGSVVAFLFNLLPLGLRRLEPQGLRGRVYVVFAGGFACESPVDEQLPICFHRSHLTPGECVPIRFSRETARGMQWRPRGQPVNPLERMPKECRQRLLAC